MVENIRPTGRVGAVLTSNRLRPVKRDRDNRDRRDQKSEDEKTDRAPESSEEPTAESNPQPAEKKSMTGKRINVII